MAVSIDIGVREVENFAERTIAQVSRVWVGSPRILEWSLAALLAQGHLLLEDVPGVGKTLLAKTLSQALGCRFTRLQLTPDILPADITGFTVYDQRTGAFRFRPGPVFTHILLADEINRTVPRTQSALLEAMQEGAVTVDGETHPLPRPFWVLATQNPVDSEGTYPLPEAQRDRFLMRIPLGYPSLAEEEEILRRFGGQEAEEGASGVRAVSNPEEICRLQEVCRRVYVSPAARQYVLALTRATRDHPSVRLGASPRASLALLWAAQSLAAMAGRAFVLPDDVKALAPVVLPHRLLLQPEAMLRGTSPEDVIHDLLQQVPVPVEAGGEHEGDRRP